MNKPKVQNGTPQLTVYFTDGLVGKGQTGGTLKKNPPHHL